MESESGKTILLIYQSYLKNWVKYMKIISLSKRLMNRLKSMDIILNYILILI